MSHLDPYLLIVEDDPDNREALTEIIRLLGIPIEGVEDGHQALERIAERVPSLILLDLMMPGLDGYSVAAYLNANPLTRHVPVVVLSAAASESDPVQNLDFANVRVVMPKGSFNVEELTKLVETLWAESVGSI